MKSTFPYLPGTSHPCPISSSCLCRANHDGTQDGELPAVAAVQLPGVGCGPLGMGRSSAGSVRCLSYFVPKPSKFWGDSFTIFDPYLRFKNTENHPTSSNYRPEMAKLPAASCVIITIYPMNIPDVCIGHCPMNSEKEFPPHFPKCLRGYPMVKTLMLEDWPTKH